MTSIGKTFYEIEAASPIEANHAAREKFEFIDMICFQYGLPLDSHTVTEVTDLGALQD